MVKWFSIKITRLLNKETTVFSTNAMKSKYLHAKGWSWALTLHHIQKLTQNGLKTKTWDLKLQDSEKNHRGGSSWQWIWEWFLRYDTKSTGKKEKKKIKQTSSKLKHLCIKGYYQQSEEETHKIGENICKLCIWYRVHIQNIF